MSRQLPEQTQVVYRVANAEPLYLSDQTQFYVATMEPSRAGDDGYMITMGFANYGQPEIYMPIASSNDITNVMILELARKHITCDLKLGVVESWEIRNLQGDLIRYDIQPINRQQILTIAEKLERVATSIVNYDCNSVYDYGILQVFCPDRFNRLPGEAGYDGIDQAVKTTTLQ